eukprot:Gb_13380 [translate_table: standard]
MSSGPLLWNLNCRIGMAVQCRNGLQNLYNAGCFGRLRFNHHHAAGTILRKQSSIYLLNWLRTQTKPMTTSAVASGNPEKNYGGEGLPSVREKLEKLNIFLKSCKPGQFHRMLCPRCGGGSTRERSFSVMIRPDGQFARWRCFRAKCGWNGDTHAIPLLADTQVTSLDNMTSENGAANTTDQVITCFTEENMHLQPISGEVYEYFAERQISGETLRRNGVMKTERNNQTVIAFTYRKGGRIVNCKYRDVKKRFWQEKSGEKVLYGLDDIKDVYDIIIVEGEIDKLSMEEAGYQNCVSVPDGAPPKPSMKDLPPKEQDKKYQYLWNCKGSFDQAKRIILATDADEPGQALAEELARRLGRERCWRVIWPTKMDGELCKDANEVLMHLGPEALKKVIDTAELYPIRGLFQFRDYFSQIDAYYLCQLGNELGVSTGWAGLDDLYRVVPGELTIVTGVPNSGKSEWIDALICNLKHKEGWTFALCSMENKVSEHARKLLEKHLKKPFFKAKYGDSLPRISPKELQAGKQWLNETFYLIRCEDDSLPSITWVLSLAKAAVFRHGIRGLVIDPYNELDHQRPSNQTETEYVSQMLTKVKRFARHHDCHVWFVAHPRQLLNWQGEAPGLYDISGSAHFINKCDNGIVIHRNRDPETGPLDQVQVSVRKVRNKLAGNIGETFLFYNRVTGEFMDKCAK